MHFRHVIVFLIAALPFWVWAQVTVYKGTQRPDNPSEGTIFLHTTREYIEVFEKGKWVDKWRGSFKDVIVCGDLVAINGTLKYSNGNGIDYGGNYFVVSSSMGKQVDVCDEIYCGERILGMRRRSQGLIFVDNQPNLDTYQRRLTAAFSQNGITFQLDTVQDMVAVSAPSFAPKFSEFQHSDKFTNWGVLGTNGQWLIPPQYDEPIHFKNGVADVVYYGQKRKINEKGEFIQ
jgi:hypothetical protein